MVPTQKEIEDAIFDAAEKAISKLFTEPKGQSFYYVALITTGEALRPYISAWSKEALAKASESPEEAELIKWSYADSPFCLFGDEYFKDVEKLFNLRPHMDHQLNDAVWDSEYNLRLSAMENAMARLDAAGIFGSGKDREALYINVEVMPPDHTNTERAMRLNPERSLIHYLKEAAE